MSDALLIEISKKLSDIHATLKAGAAPAAAGTKTPAAGNAASGGATASAKAAVDKVATDKAAADKAAAAKAAADKAAAAKAAAAKTGTVAPAKAPGGKYNIDQVREKIREVASNAALGKTTAANILEDDGGGAKRVTDLKPENFDAVYEACVVAIQGEGSAPAVAPEDDLM